MSLTEEQFEKLSFWLEEIQGNLKEISEWERNFVTDQVARIEQYKSDVRMSAKQWAKLEDIYRKATGG